MQDFRDIIKVEQSGDDESTSPYEQDILTHAEYGFTRTMLSNRKNHTAD